MRSGFHPFGPSFASRVRAIGLVGLGLAVLLFTATSLGAQGFEPTSVQLTGTVRDFSQSHPDMQYRIASDPGIVEPILGPDRKPVYTTQRSFTTTTHGRSFFDQWYRDVPGVNVTAPLPLTLTNSSANPDIFTFDSSNFFPIDGQLLGNQGMGHNYYFTFEIHSQFTYRGGEVFQFRGDDDVFVFVNDHLVIDLGGVHGPQSGSVPLDSVASQIGLEVGNAYHLDFFFAERYCCGSNFRMQTSILLEQPPETGGGATLEPAGDLTGDFDDPVTLAARLLDNALDPPAPIPDSIVTFTLGGRSCRAPTDEDGLASCAVTPDLPAGDHELTARFAGDVGHPAAERTETFRVTPEQSALALVSSPVQAGQGGTLRAVLREDGALPLGGRTVSFAAGGLSADALTGEDGLAEAVLDLPPGDHAVEVSFAGDEHHEAASASGSLRVLPPQIVLSPSAQGATAGNAVSLTAHLLDQGAPRDGIPVRFAVTSGPNAGAAGSCGGGACLTGAAGEVTFTYTGGPATGEDRVVAFVDLDGDGTPDATDPRAEAAVLWAAPAATVLRLAGAESGDFHDPVELGAVLEEASGAPVAGARLHFALAGAGCAATTGSDGAARCFVTPTAPAGPAELTVAFDGSLRHLPSTLTAPIAITREQTVLTLDAPPALPAGATTVSARLAEDGAEALAGRTVTFTAGDVVVDAATGPDGVATATLDLPLGIHSVAAAFAGDPFYEPATDEASSLVVYEPGQFVIWGGNAPTLDEALPLGGVYPFWGERWDEQVRAGDYAANTSFKGYADTLSPDTASWATRPGDSSTPPATVPAFTSVLVATSITKQGSTISGNVVAVGIVRVLDPEGYRPDPGHDAAGELLALLPPGGPGAIVRTPPGPPLNVQATAGTGFATVTWSPPADPGTAPVTGYSVVLTPGGLAFSAPAAARSRVVPSLVPGTAYSVQVVASNGAGPGPASASAGPVVPVDVPGAPTGVNAEPGDGALTVRWSPPAATGGTAITGYLVSASPGGTTVAAGPAATAATLSGLVNGVSYSVVVRAVNGVGQGPPSAPPARAVPLAPPGAPIQVLAAPGDGRATVFWAAPGTDGGAGIASYTVIASPGGATATVPGDRASAVVAGLADGTGYSFIVRASGPAGDGPASAPSPAVTPFGAPAAPVLAGATPGNASARVAWSAPGDDGGRPVTGYLVSEGPGTPAVATPAAELERLLTELANGVERSFVVRAVNDAGAGDPSAASEAVVPSTVPDPPTAVAATAEADGTLSVTWQAPEDDGGAPVDAYRVEAHAAADEADPGAPRGVLASLDTAGPETTAFVDGLDPGTRVVVTVRALNARGTGPQSAPTEPVTASVPPDPPTGVLAVASAPATATVTWLAPADDGGTDVVGYTVTSDPEGLTATVDGETTSALVPGLTLGTAYTFTVVAENAVGTSVPSTPSNALIGATVPGPPTAVTALGGDRQATVSWAPPASDGFSPISSYAVTASPGGATAIVTGGVTSAVVGGLANGTTYTFTVTATNTVGTGDPSAPSNPVTPATVPGAPTAVTAAVAGDRAIEVSWTPPADDGASAITAYTVLSSPDGLAVTVGAATTSATVDGLSAGTAYTFTVTATNGVGDGLPSAPSNAVVAATVPGAPTGVVAVDGDGQATVSWTPPADDGASPITAYTVQSNPGGLAVTVDAATTSTTVGALTNGTSYTFTVTATNALGDGPPSSPSEAVTPAGLPGAPTAVVAEVGGNAAARVSWTPPASDGGAAITSYTVVSSPGGLTATVPGDALPGETLQATVDGLTLGTSYTFTVTATNRRGDGPPSAPSNPVTAVAVPDPPTGVTAGAGDGSATVSWTAPADQGGGPVTSYRVVSAPGAVEVVVTAPDTTATVGGLDNATTYTFTVIATNAVGDSPPSEPSNPVTPQPAGVVALSGLGVDPGRLVGGAPATGTVTLSGAAVAGGVTVTLASSDPAVASVPTQVVVPEGATSAGFAVTTSPVAATLGVTVSATLDTTTLSVVLTVDPIPAGTPPAAEIATPADDATVTAPTEVVGTASAGALDHYVLDVAPAGESAFTEIARGITPVLGGVLGTLDPTLLINDLYTLRLTVVDTSGRTATSAVTVQVEGAMKIGNFTLSFVDLSIPVSGLPVTVIRTYDSRDKGRGDFGVGWRLEIRTLRIRDNGTQGASWHVAQSSGTFPTFFLQPTRAHKVSLRLPDGRIEEFDFTPTPSSQALVPLRFLSPAYTARPGTTGRLRLAVDTQLQVIGDQPGTVELVDLDTVDVYDPQTFIYTSLDGREWLIDKVDGVRRIEDRNGNTLTIGPGGITHSSGVGVTFARDGLGRITSITDPEGGVQTYAYDAAGDLVSHDDATGGQTTFGYATGHYLTDIIDPRGVSAIRNEYDDDGRLIRSTDAAGNVVELDHDLDARLETFIDRSGRVRVVEYDDRGNVVREVDQEGGVTSRTFDAEDNILSETDPNGNTTAYTYDADGNVTSITDALGHTTTSTFDSTGRLLTTTDANGGVTENRYDAEGNLTETIDRAGNSSSFAYDASGNLTSWTDPEGGTRTFEYDAAGFLTREVDPRGHGVVLTYDGVGRRLTESTTFTGPAGPTPVVTSYGYDAAGRLSAVTLPDGGSNSAAYDDLGKLARITDVLGRETVYTYDSVGRPLAVIRPDGTGESRTYDAESHVISESDPEGRTTQHAYDGLGRLVETIHPDGTQETRTYDSAGNLLSLTDERGFTTTYEYDAAGRRTAEIDPEGAITRFGYDANGNRTSVTDPAGNATRYEYDEEDRLVRTVSPTGAVQTLEYDRAGRPVRKTDESGNVTSFAYDTAGNLVEVTDPLGRVTRYGYDEMGNRVSQTDAAGHTTRFAYDELGRLVSRTLPDGATETMTYDAAGRPGARTDFAGETTTFTYDLLNRLVSETRTDGSTVSYSYTPTGRRASVTDSRGTTNYTYDLKDRLIRLTTAEGRTLEYSRDGSGNRTAVTVDLGATSWSTRYSYDALGRIRQVTDPLGRTYDYTYDAHGSPASLHYPTDLETTWSHDLSGHLTGLETRAGDGTVVQSYLYALDAAGRRVGVAEGTGVDRLYGFDAAQQLTEETVTDPSGLLYRDLFTYDAAGNRQSRTHSTGDGTTATTTYSYDDRDRLLSAGATTFSWDALGRLESSIGAEATTYSWGSADDLLAVSLGDGSTVDYSYDADGNLVSRATADGTVEQVVDTSQPLPQVVAEIDPSGDLRAYYVRNPDGRLLAVIRPDGTRFVHADGIGSTRRLTDETGTTTDRFSFSAFGELVAHDGDDPNPFLFTGEARDSATELYDFRARWLDPTGGRFLSMDPWEGRADEPITLHRYLYAGNDPVNRLDPSGEGFFEPSDPIFGTRVHYKIAEIFGCAKGPGGRSLRRLCNREINTILRAAGASGYSVRVPLKPDLVDLDTTEVYEIKPLLSSLVGHDQLVGYLILLNFGNPIHFWEPGSATTFPTPPSITVDGRRVVLTPPLSGLIIYTIPDRNRNILTVTGAVVVAGEAARFAIQELTLDIGIAGVNAAYGVP